MNKIVWSKPSTKSDQGFLTVNKCNYRISITYNVADRLFFVRFEKESNHTMARRMTYGPATVSLGGMNGVLPQDVAFDYTIPLDAASLYARDAAEHLLCKMLNLDVKIYGNSPEETKAQSTKVVETVEQPQQQDAEPQKQDDQAEKEAADIENNLKNLLLQTSKAVASVDNLSTDQSSTEESVSDEQEPADISVPIIDVTQNAVDTSKYRVCIFCDDEKAVIRYTTSGKKPGATAKIYHEPFEIAKPYIIKAAAFVNGKSSDIVYTESLDEEKGNS